MIGVKDVAFPLLHLIKMGEFKGDKFYKSSFTKVIFVAYAECFLYDLPMTYDILFEKSRYGASSTTISDLISGKFEKYVVLNNAKENTMLTNEKALNDKFIKLIKKEAEGPFAFANYITTSDVFVESNFKKNERKSIFNRNILLLPMEIDQVWTLSEIMLFAGVDKDKVVGYDCRVPLNQKRYNAIRKYLVLYDKFLDDMDSEIPFTIDDIHEMRYVSEQLLDSIRVHGAKVVSDIDNK